MQTGISNLNTRLSKAPPGANNALKKLWLQMTTITVNTINGDHAFTTFPNVNFGIDAAVVVTATSLFACPIDKFLSAAKLLRTALN